jgi:hypothetical protein
MKTTLGVLLTLVLASACTPHYKKGEIAYDWVGCHVVGSENPKNGETAFAFITSNKLKEGQLLYFKQVDTSTEESRVGKVQTATPCK